MAYRFNNGRGGVTCDQCNILFDEDLGCTDYKKIYGDKGDICWECKEKNKEREEQREKDILDDGWRN